MKKYNMQISNTTKNIIIHRILIIHYIFHEYSMCIVYKPHKSKVDILIMLFVSYKILVRLTTLENEIKSSTGKMRSIKSYKVLSISHRFIHLGYIASYSWQYVAHSIIRVYSYIAHIHTSTISFYFLIIKRVYSFPIAHKYNHTAAISAKTRARGRVVKALDPRSRGLGFDSRSAGHV